MTRRLFDLLSLAALCLAVLDLVGTQARAADGTAPVGVGGECSGCMTSDGQSTYYERLATSGSLAALEADTPALPTSLEINDSEASVHYALAGTADGRAEWEVRISGFNRNHERIDAVYHMLLVLPMPVNPDGSSAFNALDRGIVPQEGSGSSWVPLIYGGEKIVLKRDVALEKALLPGIIGDSASGRLPSLAGTGYGYTLWGTIVQYDASHESTLQAWATLRYQTPASTGVPDATDDRLKAYLVTWVPKLRSDVPPWAIRMDVSP